MRALLQRVTEARVTVDGEIVGEIGTGLCALVGVTHDDDEAAARKLANRMFGLRVFEDADGVPNLSISEAHARPEILVVSQFTLYGDTRKGRRPSWIAAARPEQAEPLIEVVIDELASLGAHVATGRFRTDMKVALVNDGPFTVTLDT